MLYLTWLAFCVCLNSGVTGDDVGDVKGVLNALQVEADKYLTELLEVEKLYKTLYYSYDSMRNDIVSRQDKSFRAARTDLYSENKRLRKMSLNKTQQAAGLPAIAETATADEILRIESSIENARSFQNEKIQPLDGLLEELKQVAKIQSDVSEWTTSTIEKVALKLQGDDELKNVFDDIALMNRQVQLQQFNEEEKTRSDGNSGIKQIRDVNVGGKTYDSNTFTGKSFASIHNLDNFKNTAGIGEFVAVLNGVEFRTRRNDYELKQPATDDLTYHKTEDVEHPDVPPEVKAAGNVSAQIEEMREWFRAFKNQDFSVRDYRKYFPAVMCYLEGAYEEVPSDDLIDKPLYSSGQRELNATTYSELYEKIRYTSYSGEKESSENLAYLPKTIMDVNEQGVPVPAQWGYRILCHKLKGNLPTSYLDLVTDITSQKLSGASQDQYVDSMMARFDLQGRDHNGIKRQRAMDYSYLDSLMEEVPGKNNYGAMIRASGFGSENIFSANPKKAGQRLNGAYYHRPYKLAGKDAMGSDRAQRGYADIYYLSLTTQERVAGPKYKYVPKGTKRKNTIHTRASFAVPIEVIYLNPLAKWNPYQVAFKETSSQTKDGRTSATAFEYNTKDSFYQTPSQFYKDEELEKIRHVRTNTQSAATVRASGIRVLLPEIEGVGKVRQRYPIMPVYSEGSSLSKKLNAFEDILNGVKVEEYELYATGVSTNQIKHTHIIKIKKADYDDLVKNPGVVKNIKTERTREHEHNLGIKYENESFFITSCDSKSSLSDATHFCWDGHGYELTTSH